MNAICLRPGGGDNGKGCDGQAMAVQAALRRALCCADYLPPSLPRPISN